MEKTTKHPSDLKCLHLKITFAKTIYEDGKSHDCNFTGIYKIPLEHSNTVLLFGSSNSILQKQLRKKLLDKMSCYVTVFEGTLEGKICSGIDGQKYYSFEGIPYAKPPIGKLRFRDPQEPESWSGIRPAKKPGNKCAQINPYGNSNIEGSEDCLYLNVYTPILPTEEIEKLPVLVFIHGGKYILGCGDYNRPDYLIRHNIILVTVNYRLHILGFLCLNIPEVPGNAGLKDSIMALKWVKRNISEFNGDVNNVTAFGDSAGAGTVFAFIISKMSDGLIHKVICQSGTCLSDLFMDNKDPIDKSRQICSYLGLDNLNPQEMYEVLLSTPLNDLIYAMVSAELSQPPNVSTAVFLPVVEKKFNGVEQFFSDYPFVVIKENRFKKLPMIFAINSHEGALFFRKDELGNPFFDKNFQYFIPRYLYIKYDSPKAKIVAKSIRDNYFGEKNIPVGASKELLNLLSDHYVARDIILSIELILKFHAELFLCRFAYEGNLNTRTMKTLNMKGATHGDIIQYIFYKQKKASKCTVNDMKIIDTLTESWCNFAKYSKPTWKNKDIAWLPYSKQDRFCLNITNDGFHIETYPEYERLKFWLNLLEERSKL